MQSKSGTQFSYHKLINYQEVAVFCALLFCRSAFLSPKFFKEVSNLLLNIYAGMFSDVIWSDSQIHCRYCGGSCNNAGGVGSMPLLQV
jgi:hypothetical protein